jgi:hypothetical protein
MLRKPQGFWNSKTPKGGPNAQNSRKKKVESERRKGERRNHRILVLTRKRINRMTWKVKLPKKLCSSK